MIDDDLFIPTNIYKVFEELKRGGVFGEVGVLCYRPQVCTARTKRLSQLLRLNRSSLLNILQANIGDGTIIMNNLVQVFILVFVSSLANQLLAKIDDYPLLFCPV